MNNNKDEGRSFSFRRLVSDNTGATAIEYALISALIAVATLTAVQSLGSSISGTFQATANAVKN